MGADADDWVSADASFISRKVFADDGIYRLEQERIFRRAWIYLAHETELRNHGDFVTTYMGEVPVIVARTGDGEIVASVNSCTHRGLPVCRVDKGHAARFVCPFHNWSYGLDGQLLAVPQQIRIEAKVDRSRLGLTRVPRVEKYNGLIFGSLNADIESLDQYLGNMRFYLDTFFDRFPGGVEVIGAPHKWRLACNWKMPVENQLGDVGHGPFLHGVIIGASAAVSTIEAHGFNMAPEPGHGAALRLLPEDTPDIERMWGNENGSAALLSPETQEFLIDTQRQLSKRRDGALQARIKGLTYGVYPNFSFLWANSTIRVSHPRGPGVTDYWSWWVVPAGAPDAVKRELRSTYIDFFGPGGMLELEDSYAWSQQYVGSASTQGIADQSAYYYGLGVGEETTHPLLPGMAGSCYNELYARQFYLRWKRDLAAGEIG